MQHLLVMFAAENSTNSGAGGWVAAAAASLCFAIFYLGLFLLIFAGMWGTFAKAGKPGWAAIVPIYNVVVLLEIAGKPLWWIVLYLIPFVNVIASILVSLEIANAFRKGSGFGLGLAFFPFIFYPILGFGSAKYVGVPSA